MRCVLRARKVLIKSVMYCSCYYSDAYKTNALIGSWAHRAMYSARIRSNQSVADGKLLALSSPTASLGHLPCVSPLIKRVNIHNTNKNDDNCATTIATVAIGTMP
jgi:hypothetical protein